MYLKEYESCVQYQPGLEGLPHPTLAPEVGCWHCKHQSNGPSPHAVGILHVEDLLEASQRQILVDPSV